MRQRRLSKETFYGGGELSLADKSNNGGSMSAPLMYLGEPRFESRTTFYCLNIFTRHRRSFQYFPLFFFFSPTRPFAIVTF